MIQFQRAYEINGKRMVIGQKVTLIPEWEEELIKSGIAKRSTWSGKIEKLKTNFFKPKE